MVIDIKIMHMFKIIGLYIFDLKSLLNKDMLNLSLYHSCTDSANIES